MKNKIPLIISALTAAILLTVGIGLIQNVNGQPATAAPTVAAAAPMDSARELEYQKLIADANARITLANQQIEKLASQVTVAPTGAVSEYLFSSDQAAALAANISGEAPLSPPELVNFNGITAYEASFSNGKVYIDANLGRVVFNGLERAVINITSAQASDIAARYLNRNDLSSVESSTFNGSNVFVVSFSDGTLLYVDLSGKILAVQEPQQVSSSSGTAVADNLVPPTDDHEDHEEHDD